MKFGVSFLLNICYSMTYPKESFWIKLFPELINSPSMKSRVPKLDYSRGFRTTCIVTSLDHNSFAKLSEVLSNSDAVPSHQTVVCRIFAAVEGSKKIVNISIFTNKFRLLNFELIWLMGYCSLTYSNLSSEHHFFKIIAHNKRVRNYGTYVIRLKLRILKLLSHSSSSIFPSIFLLFGKIEQCMTGEISVGKGPGGDLCVRGMAIPIITASLSNANRHLPDRALRILVTSNNAADTSYPLFNEMHT